MANKRESGKQKFEIACASRGFHVYCELWKPKLGQKLQIDEEIGNIHDLFAISLGAKIVGKLTDNEIVGHIPCEISRFCHYFINYGGKLESRVTCTKYRPSPIPSASLEMPILLIAKKGDSTEEIFEKMEDLLRSYYVEPDKIVVEKKDKEIDFDVEYVSESEMEASQAAQDRGDATSQELIPETQTQVIPETQDIGNTQTIPETQIDRANIIVIDD